MFKIEQQNRRQKTPLFLCRLFYQIEENVPWKDANSIIVTLWNTIMLYYLFYTYANEMKQKYPSSVLKMSLQPDF